MKVDNIRSVKSGFKVLQTTERSQTAVMILPPGGQSSEKMNVHRESDQVLLVIEGEVLAEIDGEKRNLQAGDSCVVPAGSPHRFQNVGQDRALTFNVYTPPEYSANEKD